MLSVVTALFNYADNFIYDGDARLAERKAATPALDYFVRSWQNCGLCRQRIAFFSTRALSAMQ